MAESKQLGVVLLVAAAGLAAWQFGDKDSDASHKIDDHITTVQLAADRSDVSIEVTDDDTTTVQEKRRYWFWKHGDTYSVDNGVLKLDGDCGWQCSADFVVKVPRGTKVTGENGSGDVSLVGVGGVDLKARSGEVKLADVSGDVKLDLTSGDVTIDDLTGKLDATTMSGDIEANGLKGGAVSVQTTSGDMDLDLAEANDVQAKGTSGDIDITAPQDSYTITTDTSHGDVDSDLTTTSDAPHTIKATTTSGDITLHAH